MPVASFAVPVCTPTRLSITHRARSDLARYHFDVQSLSVDVQHSEQGKPLYWLVKVGFTPQAAAWGEYVMIRCGWHRIPPFIEPRNAAWAGQYVYVPDGHGLYESDCKDRPKPKPGSAEARGLAQQKSDSNDPTVYMPQRNAPTPWDSQPRARQSRRQPGPRAKRKRGWLERLFD